MQIEGIDDDSDEGSEEDDGHEIRNEKSLDDEGENEDEADESAGEESATTGVEEAEDVVAEVLEELVLRVCHRIELTETQVESRHCSTVSLVISTVVLILAFAVAVHAFVGPLPSLGSFARGGLRRNYFIKSIIHKPHA